MTSLNIGSLVEINNDFTVKNRLFKSAMSEQLGDKYHNPTTGLFQVYKTWAEGGIGLSVTGNVMVDRTALGEPKNVVLDEQSDLSLFEQWAKAGKVNNSKIWMQLNHPGKQIPSFLSKEPVAPLAISLGKGLDKAFNKPRALTEPEIIAIIDKFATSAKFAKDAGFDGVQIHGAHGYLVSQFLSSRHNKREDKWGGSLENRMRFVVELYDAMRAKVGSEFPIGIKLNSADYMKGGFTPEESMQVIKKLGDIGIDLIEISGGTYESPSMVGHKIKDSTKAREAYFLDYAEQARSIVSTKLVVTGGFRSTKAMNNALASGATDMVGLARPLAIYPHLPNQAMQDESFTAFVPTPTTGLRGVDKMAMLSITWFETQIARIAKGKSPKSDLSAWVTVIGIMKDMGRQAFKPRRA